MAMRKNGDRNDGRRNGRDGKCQAGMRGYLCVVV
jgi:hypothetical protein